MLKEIRSIGMEGCKAACVEHPKCASVDFSNTNDFINDASCRLFDSTKFNWDSGMNDRRFCAKGKSVIILILAFHCLIFLNMDMKYD